MSFETKNQEWVRTIVSGLVTITIYMGAAVGLIWMIKACDLGTENKCVCDCGGEQ